MSKPKQYQCPVCKKLLERDASTFPFCCERCKIVDLGNWASEKYRVPVSESSDRPDAAVDEESG